MAKEKNRMTGQQRLAGKQWMDIRLNVEPAALKILGGGNAPNANVAPVVIREANPAVDEGMGLGFSRNP